MNVFVLSTGRCGSTTFARACENITNFSSAHESKSGKQLRGLSTPYETLQFPDDHIEVDNRLSWFLGTLDKTHGRQGFYVHLLRDREEVARSFLSRWDNRGTNIIRAYAWGPLTLSLDQLNSLSQDQRLSVCRHYWETVNDNIDQFLADKPHQMKMWLHDIHRPFEEFWERIGAEGDLDRALAEWQTVHNASHAGGQVRGASKEGPADSSPNTTADADQSARSPVHVTRTTGDIALPGNEVQVAIAKTQHALDNALTKFSQIDFQRYESSSAHSSWSLDADTLKFLVALVRCMKPEHILELGSGHSTRVLLRVTQELDTPCGVSSIDHDPDFVEHTRSCIPAELAERLGLQFAPLVTRQFGESFLPAYRIDSSQFARSCPIDLCVIDGPPVGLGGREGTLYQVLPFCRPGTCVLLDDASRHHERKVLERWSTLLGDAVEFRDLEGFRKGLTAAVVHRLVHPGQLLQHRLDLAARELDERIPGGSTVLIIDEYQWPDQFSERVAFQIERETSFPLAKTAEVIDALRCKAAGGIDFVAFGWPAFWWFNYFKDLQAFLDRHARRVVSSSRVVAYDLRYLEDGAGSGGDCSSASGR